MGPAAKEVSASGFIDAEDFPPLLDLVVENKTITSSSSNSIHAAPSTEEQCATASTPADGIAASKRQAKKRKLQQPPGSCPPGTGPVAVDPIIQTGRSLEALHRTRSYLRQGVDRMIIATKYRPLPILKQALYVLLPSSSFVIYHEFMEPLVDCYLHLQETGLGIRLQLFDSWLREFQTLPGRMRPDMFMTTHGGFILTGIYVGMVPCEYPRECSYIRQNGDDAHMHGDDGDDIGNEQEMQESELDAHETKRNENM